jgi:hypothetical protein
MLLPGGRPSLDPLQGDSVPPSRHSMTRQWHGSNLQHQGRPTRSVPQRWGVRKPRSPSDDCKRAPVIGFMDPRCQKNRLIVVLSFPFMLGRLDCKSLKPSVRPALFEGAIWRLGESFFKLRVKSLSERLASIGQVNPLPITRNAMLLPEQPALSIVFNGRVARCDALSAFG